MEGTLVARTARMIVAGLYVLAMLVAAAAPASAAGSMHAPVARAEAAMSDCGSGTGMERMSHDVETAKVAGACGGVDHQSAGSCMIGSVCADLPSGVFAGVVSSRSLLPDGHLFPASSPSLSGLDPDPGLRPPSRFA